MRTRPAKWAVFCIAVVVLLASCGKPEPDLGLELLPGDPLGVSGTATPLHAYTFRPEPIRTSGLTRNLLGSYLDPQFGLVKAGIVAQLRLSSTSVGFNTDTASLVADSLVLALAFDGANNAYGGLAPQRFKVFELTGDLSVETVYHTDDVPETHGVDLVRNRGGTITPRPSSGVPVVGDTLAPHLRIRLSDELAGRFLSAFGTNDLLDQNTFLQFFKGLFITVDNGGQLPLREGILYMNLLSAVSKATLYYHDTLPRSYDFPINENSVRYTVVEFDHQQAPDQGVVQALADTTVAAGAVYLQALGGLRTAVRLPDIMEHAVPGRALSRAQLVVPLKGSFNAQLQPPAQIFLFQRDAEGEEAFLPDQLGGLGNIDGNYNGATREYRFNITRYVQGVLNGQIPNHGFELVAGSSGISANRVVLAGPDEPEGGMRLLLTFTTY